VEDLGAAIHGMIRAVEQEGVPGPGALRLGGARLLERLDVEGRVVDLTRGGGPGEAVGLTDQHAGYAGDHHPARLHRAGADVDLPVDVRIVEPLLRPAPEQRIAALAA